MAISNVQQVLYRRGSRVFPLRTDRSFHPRVITGTGAGAAEPATVAGAASLFIEGTGAAQALQASVSGKAPDVIIPVRLTTPVPAFFRRTGRIIILSDEAVYKNVPVGTKEGTGGFNASLVTVSAAGIRTIKGTGAAAAQSATVVGNTPEVTGIGSAQAQVASASGAGQVILTGADALHSQPATVSGTGARIVTGTGTPAAESATASGQGQLEGLILGNGAVSAQPATATGTGNKTFEGTGAVQAQAATVSGSGVIAVPDIPIFNPVPDLLSRHWRDLSIDFHRWLEQGAEPITFAVVVGALPAGLALDPQTGIVTGKPTTIGYWDLQIDATNISGSSNSGLFRWVISDVIPQNAPHINPNLVAISGI